MPVFSLFHIFSSRTQSIYGIMKSARAWWECNYSYIINIKPLFINIIKRSLKTNEESRQR